MYVCTNIYILRYFIYLEVFIMNDNPNWFIRLFKYKVCGKGHWYEDQQGIKHWYPAPCYWTWKWNK